MKIHVMRKLCIAIHHFLEHDLDCMILATNTPGRSAFNRMERRMEPLSRELVGNMAAIWTQKRRQ